MLITCHVMLHFFCLQAKVNANNIRIAKDNCDWILENRP